jgi:hypothetical protein
LSLLDEAHGLLNGRTKGPDCSVSIAMQIHPDLSDDIAAVIRERDISASIAGKVFASKEIDISKITIERHRRNDCRTCAARGVIW